MKTAIILVLLGVITALAHFTRPSERSFDGMLARELQDRGQTASTTLPTPTDIDALMKDVTYKDRFLWADIQHNGKTVYTGAFGHWFEWGKITEAPAEKATLKLPA